METIIVLGADRVGKTTMIRNTKKLLESFGSSVLVAHFSGIDPSHHSPIQQFTDSLSDVNSNGIDFLILDRFVSDTLFYEPYRAKMPPIPHEYSYEVESLLLSCSSRLDLVLIEHEWNSDIENRHREEIIEQYPKASHYWVHSQVKKREIEHREYYKFTKEYLRSGTIIPQENIHTMDGHLYDSSVTLSYCDGLELP